MFAPIPKRDCFSYVRIESMLVGLSIVHAVIISILPTIAAIVLLSLLEVWTHLETHWLHTWLFVACVVYNLSRGSGKRRMAVTNDSLQSHRGMREVRTFSRDLCKAGHRACGQTPTIPQGQY